MMQSELLSEKLKHLTNVNIPSEYDQVYKDECLLSYDTPESETGLYICLTTFMGFGEDYVDLYYNKTKNAVFLHYIRTKTEIPIDQQGDMGGPNKKITRLAIGLEGGFDPDADKKKYQYTDNYTIVILPSYESISIKEPNLPERIKESIKKVIEVDSALRQAELSALTGTWDGEKRFISKHAKNLQQLQNGKKVPFTGWKCEKCDLTENLWLNLTDGAILCGRKYYDGSGGNNHAIQHYEETGYPLAVKLGTITKEGTGDVYSYDEAEDEMVEDPYLVQHLLHFGIDVTQMEKTEKTMVELELDLNQRFGEWSICQELGSTLVPVYGPGRTGMVNLGNSCYLNSVMQVVFSIPSFIKEFVDEYPRLLNSLDFYQDPINSFVVQMSKLGFGLCSGKYSQPPESGEDKEQKGISPKMFKYIVGSGKPEFAGNHQQDAQEFFLHIINLLERHTRPERNPSNCFKFQVEDKLQCNKSKNVKYLYRTEYCLPIPIPVEAAVNKKEVQQYEAKKAEAQAKGQKLDPESLVRPHIKFSSCLEAFSQSEIIEKFYSSAIKKETTASKTTRLSSFPEYLLIHLKKFYVNDEYQPSKLDVSVEMPDILDLSEIKGHGPQPGEQLLPETGNTPPPAPVIDETVLSELIGLGFHLEGSKKAVYFTSKKNATPAEHVGKALEWIKQHMKDSDFESPFVPPGHSTAGGSAFTADEEFINKIMEMGFTKSQATIALKKTNNNLDAACNWIFEHVDDMMTEEDPSDSSRYRLRAFISHMGTSSMVGHYVCHILKDEQWIIYNDNKVALSENPPKGLGYLYLYERINSTQ